MTDTTDVSEETKTYPNPTYAWFVAILLMFFYILSWVDRQIIAILLEPIREEFVLTDFQMSIIGGVSFGVFYATVGIFIGRLADSMNRPWLIAAGVFIWSITTAFCGAVGKFWQLVVLRMGVGVGESALLPSTVSLLADYFPPKRVAAPTSVFLLGAPLGIGLSFIIGGFIYGVAQDVTAAEGWQDVAIVGGMAAWKLVLIFLGVVGMVMTAAIFLVREPRISEENDAESTKKAIAAEPASLHEVGEYAKKHFLAIVSIYVGMALISLAAYAQAFWDVTFFERTYDVNTADVSLKYGFVQMFAGLSGMVFAGFMADRLSRRGVEASSVKMLILGAGIAVPFSFLYPYASTSTVSLWLLIPAIFGSNMCFASAASAIQRMYPGTMLGLALGVYYFLSNIVGLGIGPPAIAAVTDYVLDDPSRVRDSIAFVGGLSRIAALVLIVAGLSSYRKLVREREGSVTR